MLLLIVKGAGAAATSAAKARSVSVVDITYMPRFDECHIWTSSDNKAKVMEWFSEAHEPPLGMAYVAGTLLFFTERTDR